MENACQLKSWVKQHGYDISFPIFSNASNAGLSSLTKTKLWQREKQKEKTVNNLRAQDNILLESRLTSHRATKT